MPARGPQQVQYGRCPRRDCAGQIADHRAGRVSQRLLDRPIQIIDEIDEPAGQLEDHYPTYRVRPDSRGAAGHALTEPGGTGSSPRSDRTAGACAMAVTLSPMTHDGDGDHDAYRS